MSQAVAQTAAIERSCGHVGGGWGSNGPPNPTDVADPPEECSDCSTRQPAPPPLAEISAISGWR
jgi:hypothetical protein